MNESSNNVKPDLKHGERRFIGQFEEALRVLLPLLVLAIGVGGAIAFVKSRKSPETEEPERQIAVVETVEVLSVDHGFDLEIDGIVVPYREVRLSAQVSGKITFKSPLCDEGRYVEAGTLLLEIEPFDYENEVQRLQQEIQQSENSIAEAELTIENTKDLIVLAEEEAMIQEMELERIESLREDSFASDSECDQIRRLAVVAKTAVMRLENQLETQNVGLGGLLIALQRVEIQLARAEQNLARTKIVAPTSGVVLSAPVELDWFVNIGRELVAIEDLSKAEVRCQVRGDQLYWVLLENEPPSEDSIPHEGHLYELPQTPVTIEYERGGILYAWNGVLSRYDGIGLDEQTRTVPCRVLVEDPRSAREVVRKIAEKVVQDSNELEANEMEIDSSASPALLRGMYVTVNIHASPKAMLLSVPEEAIQPNETLFVAREDTEGTERLDIVPIEIIDIEGENAVVRPETPGTLASGQRVIYSPMPLAIKGMEIIDRRNLPSSEEAETPSESSP
jgi:multidrug efflux pump subunit AcrA (membrane-fusion protein)